jgi:hypothetical protein
MSGVELAGLVLGILPLAISAMETYNEGLDPVKAFFGWEKELPKFIRRLRNQHVHYEQTLRQLLGPIVSEEELAEMLTEPNGELWKDEEIAEKMDGKLAESKLAYRNTMADIERIMKKIAIKLDLEGADAVCGLPLNSQQSTPYCLPQHHTIIHGHVPALQPDINLVSRHRISKLLRTIQIV